MLLNAFLQEWPHLIPAKALQPYIKLTKLLSPPKILNIFVFIRECLALQDHLGHQDPLAQPVL